MIGCFVICPIAYSNISKQSLYTFTFLQNSHVAHSYHLHSIKIVYIEVHAREKTQRTNMKLPTKILSFFEMTTQGFL